MMKKIIKFVKDIEYKRYMWTCNKVFNPNAGFFKRLALYREMMRQAKSAKIPRIDDIESYMREQNK